MKKLFLLFVADGNTCSAQIAQGWARHLLHCSPLAQHYEIQVWAAGPQAMDAASDTAAVMAEAGIDISANTAEPLTTALIGQADWMVTLGSAIEALPDSETPPAQQRQHWPVVEPLPADGDLQALRACRDQIAKAVQGLVARLEQEYLGLPEPLFTRSDVEISERKVLYRGFFEMQQLTLRHQLFNGGWSRPFTRELFVRGLAVVALLYDPDREKLVLVEQFRVGSIEDQRSPWLLELVAGIVEEGEPPEEVVRREAMEEAGCRVGEVTKMYEYWVSPGANSERVAIYCARVDTEGVGGVHGLEDENEDIRVKVVTVDWALAAVDSGIINNAATIIALQWLQLNRDRLRHEWHS